MTETLLPARRCQGITKAGDPCRTNIVGDDGWCVVHRPSSTYDPRETGRAGGIVSGEVRRALANTARERLRRLADEDREFWERLKAAYKDGLDAVDPDGNPDFRARVMTAGAFLAEAYGKPPQAIIGSDDQPLRFVLESAFARGAMSPPAELRLSSEALEQLAQRVADLVSERVSSPPQLVDADAVARHLCVEREWVYEHAAEIGARRLGNGPKARLRFSLEDVDAAIVCLSGRKSGKPSSRVAEPIRRRRRTRPLGTSTPLLPIRGSGRPFSGGSAA